ncbi:hypothetical protein O181_031715 [Austropuccinia psidii MF-1]|uniref:Chromo domain-containing protein n=1 Tax=Austropuccinia psidii MF-1 TaxID=1389203 RepID=A0A9Q3CYF1_9BASI|nr:hypothetical protein [Austropuccinia psidii MF-1]
MSEMLKIQKHSSLEFWITQVSTNPIWSLNPLSMDFITQLPLSNNFDSILVVVDRLSKIAIFIPAYGTITALELAQIFISHVFSKHGLPVSIFIDRGSLFVSSFWTNLCQQLKISRDISTAFHPETYGQTERKIGSHAYHLKLPQKWKSVHPVFHVSLLEPVKQSSIPNCHQLPPPPALVEEQEEWVVAYVLDSKLKRGKLWYLVEWKGFSEDPQRTTWEPASNLTNSPDFVKDFHSFYSDQDGPNTSRV